MEKNVALFKEFDQHLNHVHKIHLTRMPSPSIKFFFQKDNNSQRLMVLKLDENSDKSAHVWGEIV